jgi:hypothetical protein
MIILMFYLLLILVGIVRSCTQATELFFCLFKGDENVPNTADFSKLCSPV